MSNITVTVNGENLTQKVLILGTAFAEVLKHIESFGEEAPVSIFDRLASYKTGTFEVEVYESSFVTKLRYNFGRRELTVKLSGQDYTYENSSVEDFLDFLEADSKGTHFNKFYRYKNKI